MKLPQLEANTTIIFLISRIYSWNWPNWQQKQLEFSILEATTVDFSNFEVFTKTYLTVENWISNCKLKKFRKHIKLIVIIISSEKRSILFWKWIWFSSRVTSGQDLYFWKVLFKTGLKIKILSLAQHEFEVNDKYCNIRHILIYKELDILPTKNYLKKYI